MPGTVDGSLAISDAGHRGDEREPQGQHLVGGSEVEVEQVDRATQAVPHRIGVHPKRLCGEADLASEVEVGPQ